MKGFRFYADLPGTHKTDGSAIGRGWTDKPLLPARSTVRDLREYAALCGTLNCIAVLTDDVHACPPHGDHEALAAVFGYPDSDTALTAPSRDYMRKCRRIPESLARSLHPRLFARLDSED